VTVATSPSTVDSSKIRNLSIIGGKDLDSDLDVTELTVIEVLVARLARLSFGARRR